VSGGGHEAGHQREPAGGHDGGEALLLGVEPLDVGHAGLLFGLGLLLEVDGRAADVVGDGHGRAELGVRVEAVALQGAHRPLGVGHRVRRQQRAGERDRLGQPRVPPVHRPLQAGQRLDADAPVVAVGVEVGRGRVEAHHPVHHQQDELFLVGDVAIDRHRRDAQLAGEAAHRQAGQALGVGDRDGGADDQLPVGPGGHGAGRDDRAHAGLGVHQALVAQVGDHLAGRGHRHPELGHDLPGRRDPLARARPAGGDAGGELGGDHAIDRRLH
jgi:hypothetical protein